MPKALNLSVKKPLTQLQLHLSLDAKGKRLCGCSVENNPLNCVYQPFLDGWDFTPQVGNGQSRGEIFTPRFIIDKMIVEAGILPAKAVYHYNYKTRTKQEAFAIIDSKVNEPAVGTGNFIATILWHKVEYAHAVATTNGVLDRYKYDLYVARAIASVYCNDIDCGNLQVVKWRLLRLTEIYAEPNILWWVNYALASIHHRWSKDEKVSVEQQVRSSMAEASANWGVADHDGGGVVDVLYRRHTGQEPSSEMKQLWVQLMDANIKLFNGISQQDSVDEGFYVAGWRNVEWSWWNLDQDEEGIITAKATPVSMARQIETGRLEELEIQKAELTAKMIVTGESDLVSVLMFEDEKDRKQYRQLLNKIEQQKQRIEALNKRPPKAREQKVSLVRKLAGPTLF